ncbi:MAG: hypothetical protein IT221_08290 [Fluviicola sp.]|nr:hypothetical protein [Fluviicola sp.]
MRVILIAGIIILTSCTKFGRTHTAKGRVMNPITGEGIPDVEMKLLKSTLGLPGGKKSVKETTSNSDGFFEISKSGLNVYYLQCNTSADYYELGWFENGQQISTAATDYKLKMGKTLHADFYAVPYGELKISLHNVNCQGSNDSLIYKRNYTSFNGISVFQPFTFTGCYDNDGAYAKVPSGSYSIEWTVIRNGVSNSFSNILNVPGNGQAEFNIDY